MSDVFEGLVGRYPDLAGVAGEARRAAERLITCYRAGGKVLLCGNGGSAADAEHVVGELMKGFLSRRPLGAELRRGLTSAYPEHGPFLAERLQGALPAISLVSQTALLTAIANDIAGDLIFAQQVLGYGRPGDVLIAVSTSGTSPNVLHALRVARVLRLVTVGFSGRTGGEMAALCDVAVCVPLDSTAEVQERHLALYHAVCAEVERALFS